LIFKVSILSILSTSELWSKIWVIKMERMERMERMKIELNTTVYKDISNGIYSM
jgi:hypothetical protein